MVNKIEWKMKIGLQLTISQWIVKRIQKWTDFSSVNDFSHNMSHFMNNAQILIETILNINTYK